MFIPTLIHVNVRLSVSVFYIHIDDNHVEISAH